MATTLPKRVLAFGRYEVWFLAQLMMGLVYVGGAMFLLPPFTLSLQGSTPGNVGIFMAILPLLQMSVPLGQFLGLVVVAVLLGMEVGQSGIFLALAVQSMLNGANELGLITLKAAGR